MTKKMLIDATHKEETRVAITDGNKLIEYDYESQSRKPLKGSIFLAKVTRVEPSLQAAFVNFGGNRHGFLPFSEIHPDYFRIPIADREALMAEQEAFLKEQDEEEALEEAQVDELGDDNHDDEGDVPEPIEVGGEASILDKDEETEAKKAEGIIVSDVDEEEDSEVIGEDATLEPLDDEELSEEGNNDEDGDNDNKKGGRRDQRGRGRGRGNKRAQYRNRSVEVVGGEEIDEDKRFRFNLRRKYKIQEVIKRGQIMLVQVNKEERGNKGAAVGSYLSLPGRYCVLMPNSPRAGGVSRKIANHQDRARMREIVKDLEVPKGMSVIVRTAGVARTKAEIKRDLDYLMRLWDNIRELTLQSTAPAVVYEEADLIKRSVRDLYSRDVEEILVAGEEGFETAKNFMKMMIPSHVKKVVQYQNDQLPLFNRYQIESQIDEIGQVEVRLKSGGYLVINPTEALVSIDVNSGKSTKGRHIEETALKTNLEAADEVARQLKLRDLGGLVVIDFIDMEERRNNAKVERRMKEALSSDRARVQVGRISSFGLMELSRQRLSPSLTEAQYEKCKTCSGLGLVRTAEAMSILVLRAIEDEGLRARAAQIIVQVTNDVALYLLNYKRKKLVDLEVRYGFEVLLRVDNDIPASECRVEVSRPIEASEDGAAPVAVSAAIKQQSISFEDDEAEETEVEETQADGEARRKEGGRRRGRRGGRNRNNRSHNAETEGEIVSADNAGGAEQAKAVSEAPSVQNDLTSEAEAKSDKPKRRRTARSKKSTDDEVAVVAEASDDAAVKKPARRRSSPKKTDDISKEAEVKIAANDKGGDQASKSSDPAVGAVKAPVTPAVKKAPVKKAVSESAVVKDYEVVNQAPKEKKKGWWNRLVE